jgi:hypothetical protein
MIQNNGQRQGYGNHHENRRVVRAVQPCAFVQRFRLLTEEGFKQEHTRYLTAADNGQQIPKVSIPQIKRIADKRHQDRIPDDGRHQQHRDEQQEDKILEIEILKGKDIGKHRAD